jgi:hypothetical protein
MSHQLDRVKLPDGAERVLRFNLYQVFNDRDQLQEVWEFGGDKGGELMVEVAPPA